MFRLSRDVRFAIDLATAQPRSAEGRNGHAGVPPLSGLGQCYYRLTVSVVGAPEQHTGYLLNIKLIDDAVRRRAIPLITQAAGAGLRGESDGRLMRDCFRMLRDAFSPHRLESIELHLSPFTSLAVCADLLAKGNPMILLHHSFEFAASHRLHNPAFSDAQNREVFGKCNNPHGHGHNYVLRVTLRGEPEAGGLLDDLAELEQIVDEAVIQPFDHRHLNLEVAEFAKLNPSVENIAMVIYRKLAGPLARGKTLLDAVTVWETPRTWCEYRE